MSEDLAIRIGTRTGVEPGKVCQVVQLAFEELHRLTIVGDKGPTDAAMEARFSFGAEAAFHLIGMFAVENAYHGRIDEAGTWNEVAMRFIPDAHREGVERSTPWFKERTPMRVELDEQIGQRNEGRKNENGGGGTETCDICFAKDREVLIRPAVRHRMDELVQEAVTRIREIGPAEFSGDSGRNDVFEEWADQVARQHSILFREYERLVEGVCRSLVESLGHIELIVLAAFSEDFDQHSCGEGFIESESLEGFDVLDAVSKELYRQTANFALKWAEGETDTSGDAISDPRERLLNQVAIRLVELLRESPDPASDRAEVKAMLREADLLYEGNVPYPDETNPMSFALAYIEDNPLLYDAVDNLQHRFDPSMIESVTELISNILPPYGRLD